MLKYSKKKFEEIEENVTDDYLEGELTMIKITRKIFSGNLLVGYKIIIDDIDYGSIRGGRSKLLDVGLGEHTIYLKINDNAVSNKISFNILDNRMIEFECGSNIVRKGFQYSSAAIAYLTRPNSGFDFLWIEMKLEKS